MLRNALLLLATVFFAVGAPAPLVWAVDYLVIDNNGASGGDGSVGDEFGTISEAIANAPLAAGDRIVVAAGNYTNAHETFPLVLPDGVSLVGAGSATTTIDASGSGAPGIVVSASGSAQALSDFTLIGESSRACVIVTGSAVDVLVTDCVFSSGAAGIAIGGSSTGFVGPGTINVSNCSFFSQSFIGVGNQAQCTGAVQVNVVSNFFSASAASYSAVELIGFPVSGSSCTWDANVTGNTISGFMGTAIQIGMGGTSGTMAGEVNAVSNLISASGNVGVLLIYGNATSTGYSARFGATCNTVRNMTGAGIAIFPGTAVIDVSFEFDVIGNLVSSCNVGFYVGTSFATSTGKSLDFDISSNCFRNNGAGAQLFHTLFTGASGTLDYDFYRNVVTSNLSDGIRMAVTSGANTVARDIDFGGGREPLGFNVIASNNQSSVGTGFDLQASILGSTTTYSAIGNWWGTTSLTVIESNVFHQVDTGALVLIDFSTPLADPMALTQVGLASVGGLLVVDTTDGGFVEAAGKKLLQATFDGNPIAVNVSADGESISFVVPLVIPGAYILVVTNPGGQTGSLSITVFAGEDGGGGCFVATASYGDEDSPEVQLLRQWRDQHLSTNAFGRQLVQTYYAVSPPLAEAIADRPWARSVSCAALAPVVGAARLWMEAPWALGGLGIAAGWLLLRRRRN